ncbi:lactonase family protein [Ornithinimicrobium humiphilum]|nr:beta-propeller fold lactonase family protein [Ornithinimicrobium humiphilum]
MTTLYLGGYTSDRPEGRSGLARVTLTEQGFGDPEPLADLADPSWVVRDPLSEDVYAVSESASRVARVRPGEGVVATAAAGVEGPAHLAVSPDGRWLVASGYGSGSLGLLDAGSLEPVSSLSFTGDGPHERQDAPHVHQSVFLDDARLLVCDLGADRVREVRIEDGELRHTGDVEMPPGAGPRHLALAPGRDDLAWVVGELDQSVSTLRREDGAWEVAQTLTTTPEGPGPGETTTGGIVVAPDGAHVYVSTRGADTVSVLAVDVVGALALRQQVVVASWPRFVGWVPGAEGRLLLVAAERDDAVDVWAVDEGLLEETGHSVAWSAPTWAG